MRKLLDRLNTFANQILQMNSPEGDITNHEVLLERPALSLQISLSNA
jgi:hypothetical protein